MTWPQSYQLSTPPWPVSSLVALDMDTHTQPLMTLPTQHPLRNTLPALHLLGFFFLQASLTNLSPEAGV